MDRMDTMISAMRNREHCNLGLTNKRIIDMCHPTNWRPALTRSNPPEKANSSRKNPF